MDETALRSQIPDSVLPYPSGIYNQSKYVFWRLIYPFHNVGRDALLDFKIIHHHGRQNFVLGRIAPGRTIEGFLSYLEGQEFGNHFIAWRDDQEVVSVRRLVNFERQYHLRIFRDGEVRGHYEYTPECHPRWHLKEIGQEARTEDFLNFLGDWVVPAASDSASGED
jgi:hypothetical protein